MFAGVAMAVRIERAEAAATRAMVEPLVGSQRAPGAFARAVGAGVATFVRRGSPMNKVIGVGLDGAMDDALLEVERAFAREDEPTRVELATLAPAEASLSLSERGYRLVGFENVLACPLPPPPPAASAVAIERADAATLPRWREVLIEGFASSDHTGAPVDVFARDAIADAVDDLVTAPELDRYLAYGDGEVLGAASMRTVDGVAVLTGSATLPRHRRRGVQAALVGARLADAHARGATLATITTAPGSQSQANVARYGFALVYARAILVQRAELHRGQR